MKHTHFLFPTVLLLLFVSFISCGKKHTAPTSDALKPVSEQEALETQQNVNRYFHSQVIPKLVDGWKELRDSDKFVTYHYRYLKNHHRWEFSEMEKVESTLSGHADTLAQRFMGKAIAWTYFPIEKRMEKDSVFDLYWTWPVPFPEGTFDQNTGEFTALRNTGGATGGCDGRGTRAHCNVCSRNLDCLLVCVGAAECNTDNHSCWELYECASGGPFGKFSSNVMR
jgi:hypothetical protein